MFIVIGYLVVMGSVFGGFALAGGHVASLFPGRESSRNGFVAFIPDSPKPPARRITLTRAALASAAHTLLLATGEPKRSALERLCAGDPALPATGLPGLVVVTDLVLASSGTNAGTNAGTTVGNDGYSATLVTVNEMRLSGR